jgi:hypothetical protein
MSRLKRLPELLRDLRPARDRPENFPLHLQRLPVIALDRIAQLFRRRLPFLARVPIHRLRAADRPALYDPVAELVYAAFGISSIPPASSGRVSALVSGAGGR